MIQVYSIAVNVPEGTGPDRYLRLSALRAIIFGA
jgi:hypothetical protein